VTTADFIEGVGLLALTAGSALIFAAVVMRRRLPELAGLPGALALALVAIAGFLLVNMLPGVAGLLSKAGVAVCAVLLLIGTAMIPRRRREAGRDVEAFPPGPPSGRLSWVLAGAAGAAYLVYLIAYAADFGTVATQHVDMTTFHLPNVARWIQQGTFWQLDEFVPYRSFGTYPNTSDVVTLGAILPFRNDFLVRFVNYPFLGITGLATYALGRELRAPAATSALLTAALLATPAVTLFALQGLADTLMLATFATGLVFLFRHRRTGLKSDLLLAGLGLGISFGTKWYAPAAVIAAITVWAAASLLERKPVRAVVLQVATLAGMVALLGGFWLLRNLVETGNPVFPLQVKLGGITLFDAPRDLNRDLIGFSLSHYVDRPGVWRSTIWPTYLHALGWISVALWAALPVGFALALGRLRRVKDVNRNVLVAVPIAAVIAIVFIFTPYTAMGFEGQPVIGWVTSRYIVPALVIAAAVAAWAIGRLGRARLPLEVLVLVGFGDALRRNDSVAIGALAAGVAVVAILAGVAAWQRSGGFPRLRLAALASGLACFALVAAGALYVAERRFNHHRYSEADSASRWVSANAPAGAKIGVTGEGFVVYPMFGPRLKNHVQYVGPIVHGMLRAYTRPNQLKAAVRKGGYDYILLQDQPIVFRRLAQRQERWLRSAGWTLVVSGRQFVVGDVPVKLYRAPS
jgi:hypothetical protein